MTRGLGWASWAFFSTSAASRYLPALYSRSPSFTSTLGLFAPLSAHAGEDASNRPIDNRKTNLMAPQPSAEPAGGRSGAAPAGAPGPARGNPDPGNGRGRPARKAGRPRSALG